MLNMLMLKVSISGQLILEKNTCIGIASTGSTSAKDIWIGSTCIGNACARCTYVKDIYARNSFFTGGACIKSISMEGINIESIFIIDA